MTSAIQRPSVRLGLTALIAASLLVGACAYDDTGDDDIDLSNPDEVVSVTSGALSTDAPRDGDRRRRLARVADRVLQSFPALPIPSDHPLDVAVSEHLAGAAASLVVLADAEALFRDELLDNVRALTSRTREDADVLEDLLASLPRDFVALPASTTERSCSKRCLDELDECAIDHQVDEDLASALMCALVFEFCLVDCLLPD